MTSQPSPPWLHPEAKKMLAERMAMAHPPLAQWTPAYARGLSLPSQPLPAPSHQISLRSEGREIQADVYVPPGTGPFPVILFLHGGGFVVGIEDYRPTLQKLAEFIPATIVTPQYRLAPEHPFPAGIQDAIAAFSKLSQDHASIFVMGDSAGGNLAANVVRHARDHSPGRVAGQILIYPWLDMTLSGASCQEFANGYGLTREKLIWYRDHYISEKDRGNLLHPQLSPLFDTQLAGHPRTFMVTAACDVIRDDGERFAGHLEKAGVTVVRKRYEGMLHGFFEQGDRLEPARELFGDIKDFITSRPA